MGKDKELGKELEKEFQGQKVIVYPGPKKELKAVISILISLSLIYGLGVLSTKRLASGYTVFAYSSSNWYGIIFLIVPLILCFYWLRKR